MELGLEIKIMGSCKVPCKVPSTWQNLIAVILGAVLGLGLRYGIDSDGAWGHYTVSKESNIEFGVAFIGDCYVNVLKSLLIPLIIPAVIIAFGSLNIKMCGKIGLGFVVYSAITTFVSLP